MEKGVELAASDSLHPHDGEGKEPVDVFIDVVKDSVDELAPVADTPAPPPSPLEQMWDIGLVYGELQPRGMLAMLRAVLPLCPLLAPSADESGGAGAASASSFWDLGSGEGVPCLLAALCTGVFQSVVGVELLPKLDWLARRHLMSAQALLGGGASPPLSSWASEGDAAALAARLAVVDLQCGDFLVADWSAAAIVFCNGTCYQDDVLKPLFKKAEGLRPGALFIITSQTCKSALFELAWTGVVAASWGTATARAYRRKKLPRWVGGLGLSPSNRK